MDSFAGRSSLLAATVLNGAICAVTVWLAGSQVSTQLVGVLDRVQDAGQQIGEFVQDYGRADISGEVAGTLLGHLTSTAMEGVEGSVILLISAI